jgi:hypothetical protein
MQINISFSACGRHMGSGGPQKESNEVYIPCVNWVLTSRKIMKKIKINMFLK